MFFLFMVFFLPFLVITASYCIVTYRIWSFSRRSKGGAGGNDNQNQKGCASCESALFYGHEHAQVRKQLSFSIVFPLAPKHFISIANKQKQCK